MFRVLTKAGNCKFSGRLTRQAVLWRSHSSGADGFKDADTPPPPLPLYKAKLGESVEVKRARLLYQSRKRGIAENGLLLSTFAAEYLKHLNELELEQYDVIINEPSNDWDIYYWMIGHKPTPAEYDNPMMDLLKEHAKNKNNDSRLVQPAL